jgi:phytol kinase
MLIITILVVLCLLVASEVWWRAKQPHDEFSRKFIHITVGTFAAFWPYFLPWNQIILLSLAFVAGVLVSQYFGVFKAIHAVERPTWGEIGFALAITVIAILFKDPVIYTVAILHMSLADGIAAIVGTMYGKSNSYKIFGHIKSRAGTLAFLVVSLVLLIAYATVVPAPPNPAILVGLAMLATVIENYAVYGLDNLLVPVLVASVLTLLS